MFSFGQAIHVYEKALIVFAWLLLQALSRMREYERLRTEGKLFEAVGNASTPKEKLVKDDLTTSSAGDVGSESSVSDVQV